MASAALIAPSVRRVKPAELARELGVSRQAIHDLQERGKIPRSEDGLIDVELARVAISSRVRPSGKTAAAVIAPAETKPVQQPDTSEPQNYYLAKTLREIAEAKIADLKYRQMQGLLVDVVQIQRAATTLAAMTRSAFEKIPDKLAERLAVETDANVCHAMLTAEIDLVLADLAAGARTLTEAEPDGRH